MASFGHYLHCQGSRPEVIANAYQYNGCVWWPNFDWLNISLSVEKFLLYHIDLQLTPTQSDLKRLMLSTRISWHGNGGRSPLPNGHKKHGNKDYFYQNSTVSIPNVTHFVHKACTDISTSRWLIKFCLIIRITQKN